MKSRGNDYAQKKLFVGAAKLILFCQDAKKGKIPAESREKNTVDAIPSVLPFVVLNGV